MNLQGQFAALAQQVAAAKSGAGSAPGGGAALPTGADNPANGRLPLDIAGLNTGVMMPQWLSRTLAGTGAGMADITRNLGNLVGLEPKSAIKRAQALDAPLMRTTAGKVGHFVGETAATAPLMMGGGELAGGGLVGETAARIAANPIGRGVLEGGVQGLASAAPGHRIGDTLLGGATGAVLPLAGKGLGRLVNGLPMTAEARALLARGVDLTPGQLNPEAQRNASEEAYQSLPLIGSMIRRARGGAAKQFAQSVFREGAAPGHVPVPGDMNEMLAAAYDSFDPLYGQAKGFPVAPKIMNEGADVPLKSAIASALRTKSSLATAAERKPVAGFLANELARLDGTSDSLLAARSNIRTKMRSLALEGDHKDVTPIFENAEQALTDALRSQLPKDALTALDTADSKYGNYKILERAVANSKDQVSGLTPSKLSEAVAKETPRGVYARGGGGPLRDLAREGKAVFEARSPATGHRIGVLGGEAELAAKHPYLAWPLAALRVGSIVSPLGRKLASGRAPGQLAAQAIRDQLDSAISPEMKALLERYGRAALTQYLLPRTPGALETAGTAGLAAAHAAHGLL